MCDAEKLQLAQERCKPAPDAGVLERQHLFSVYVHALPEFEGFPEDSIFHGRLIQDRIPVRAPASPMLGTSTKGTARF